MQTFDVYILGCGSATPTVRHLQTSQVVSFCGQLYMVDCGENAQLQFTKARLRPGRLEHIFISHLHGDHCLGLPGLVSTCTLLGRTTDLHVHGPVGLAQLFKPFIDAFSPPDMSFKVVYHEFNTDRPQCIYEDQALKVHTIPLTHRVPCCGFLFAEKEGVAHMRPEMMERYKIPYDKVNDIRMGGDYVTPGGEVVPHRLLTTEAEPARSYAYCSDTCYNPSIVPQIQGVNLLYHEATYSVAQQEAAERHFHSTTADAARIAEAAHVGQLVIGHFSARYLDDTLLLREAQAIFPNTVLACEGLKISVA